MALKPCIDCGNQTSDTAQKCPKCQSEHPHGVDCLICKRQGGTSLSIKAAVTKSAYDGSHPYYHVECIERILRILKVFSVASVELNCTKLGIGKRCITAAAKRAKTVVCTKSLAPWTTFRVSSVGTANSRFLFS